MRQVQLGKVIQIGHTSATRYFLSTQERLVFPLKISADLQEDKVWAQYVKPKLADAPENVYNICHYGFTEMMNNAIEHSEGGTVICSIAMRDGKIVMSLRDDGIGIFQKIQTALHLASMREAVLHLSKGKFTTDPKRHTGEGIFFTSRVFDDFCILSSGMLYRFHNGDWLLSREQKKELHKGTYIEMDIVVSSQRTVKEVMDQYADSELGFHKTIVAVVLSADPDDPHVSRSQAKRLLVGLERFRHIVLDFEDVKAVGQAFVDEVFRVFNKEHPEIHITYLNANPEVEFMIARGIATT